MLFSYQIETGISCMPLRLLNILFCKFPMFCETSAYTPEKLNLSLAFCLFLRHASYFNFKIFLPVYLSSFEGAFAGESYIHCTLTEMDRSLSICFNRTALL